MTQKDVLIFDYENGNKKKVTKFDDTGGSPILSHHLNVSINKSFKLIRNYTSCLDIDFEFHVIAILSKHCKLMAYEPAILYFEQSKHHQCYGRSALIKRQNRIILKHLSKKKISKLSKL